MTPEKRRKALSIGVFLYSFGMAFAMLAYGKYCIEVSLIAFGYFGLIALWLWDLIGESK